ncbi:MAG: dioxygenase [Gammaproteobacteria bacterium]|nr:dioxygenase [Gammaproteobacteria bacterium]MCP5431581.1 dioxygenase [Chromatiaceae bacterium]
MSPLPTLFVSHGAPTFARNPGRAGPLLTALGRALPRPAAVLVVSPHWTTPHPRVAIGPRLRTIHDFGGFDPVLYEIEYPAAGHPELAGRALDVLRAVGWTAEADAIRGLDHGAWVPLTYLYPEAEVPVFQVSMPARLNAEKAFAFGQALAPLAAEGVLIVGSGSLTHNLYEFGAHGADEAYVAAFAEWVRRAIVNRERDRLVSALAIAPHARRAHPTPEHFWPLLIALGASNKPWPATILEGGIDHRILAMDAYVFGQSVNLEMPPVGATGTAA